MRKPRATKATGELTQSCLEIAVELTHGPRMFDDRGHATDAVERYTGGRLTQDTDRCLVAGALRLLECSDRQISEALHCDVRSIPLMLREAEKSGRVPALKERLAQLTGTNAERSQIALGALLNRAADGNGDMDLAAMIKAVATAGGIATQNLQLLTGQPTEILALRVGAGREEIERWARDLAIPVDAEIVPPIDSEAAGKPAITEANGAFQGGRHGDDTDDSRLQVGSGSVAGKPGRTADQGEGGRGGSVGGGGAGNDDGSNGF